MFNTINIIPRRVLGCVLLAGLLLSGCGSGDAIPPTIPIVLTPTATLTPIPTETPTLAPTDTPTQVLTPTLPTTLPSQLGDILTDAKFTFYDGFDSRSTDDWKFSYCQTIKDGELDYSCEGNNSLSRNYVFYAGEGILVDFMKVESADDYEFGITLYNSDWASPLVWQSFGITDSLNLGSHFTIIRRNGAMVDIVIPPLKPNVWYSIAMGVDANGRILEMTWERDNPTSNPWVYRNTLGVDWASGLWIFWVNNEIPVNLRFDNFYQLAFNKIN